MKLNRFSLIGLVILLAGAICLVLKSAWLGPRSKGNEPSQSRKESTEVVRLDPAILDAYAGQYQASPDTIVTVRREDNHLTLHVNHQSSIALFPESDREFFFVHEGPPTKVSFIKDERGRVTQLILHRGGDHPATRIDVPLSSGKVQTVDFSGEQFRVLQTGKGNMTVVLFSGIEYWAKVRTKVEDLSRVVSYEQESEAMPGRGHAQKTARETAVALHGLLGKVRARPPYLLVGQSFGGALVRIYADLFPEDVVGLVLVDP